MTTAISIPAEACYWVRLPASPRRWTRERILAGIEPWIPSAIDRLDLAWQVGGDGQTVVVAIEPERLDAALANTPGAWSAVPERVPEHVAAPGIDAADFNLLTGARAPRQLRQLERTLTIAVVAVALISVILLGVGAWRQTASLRQDRQAIAAAGEQQLAACLPEVLCGNDPDPLLRLDQAKRLTGALVRAAEGSAGCSASVFAALLGAWPADLRAQVASVSVDGNRCSISGSAASVEETQRLSAALASALAAQPGWHMLPLQAVNGDGAVTFTCTLVREGA